MNACTDLFVLSTEMFNLWLILLLHVFRDDTIIETLDNSRGDIFLNVLLTDPMFSHSCQNGA